MKTKINSENKAKLFAQYWGQNVMSYLGLSIHKVDCKLWQRLNHRHLSLKPLSSITDEDAIEVAKMCDSEHEQEIVTIESVKLALVEAISKIEFSMPVIVIDYLRSKGYALPWMGLSVDEMVQAGWIKLSGI